MRKIFPITNVCDFQGGSQPPKSEWSSISQKGYVRMLQIRDFTQSNKNYIEFVKESKSLKKCSDDDILIGRYGASIGKILTGLSGAYNVALIKTKPKPDKLLKRYLKYILESSEFQIFITNIGSRAAQAGFNKSDLSDFKILLPSLFDQQRIATILDHADSIRRKNEQILEKYNELEQSVFYEMFGDLQTNPKAWPKIRLGDLGKLTSGSTPSRDNPEYYKGIIPWVKTGEVNGTLILDTEEKITQDALNNSSCKLYPKNSIIIAMYGQGVTRGKVAILGICATTNQACAVIPPNDIMNSIFLFSYLKMAYENLREMGRGGNQPNLNVGMLKDYEILNPPMELQIRFSEVISKIESQKHLSEQSLKKSEELFQSLLQRAFRGEL
ncbi:MAG: restriction endonuclease subunit S [Bacteroidales bacterium]|nr:restriction endonuclease subunit S [Bacteroidales bacterium]